MEAIRRPLHPPLCYIVRDQHAQVPCVDTVAKRLCETPQLLSEFSEVQLINICNKSNRNLLY